MRISLLCSDSNHPVNQYLAEWMERQKHVHDIELVEKKSELSGGDFLFLISCSEVIGKADRERYTYCLVLHASDLPHGRGWNPHVWQIIEGAEEITVSLIEADNRIDTGRIWKKIKFPVAKHALWDEINGRLFLAEIELIEFAIRDSGWVEPQAQAMDVEATYYPPRKPEDSRIDPLCSISEQFDKIRICDPLRFPAFFELYGVRYKLVLEKIDG